MSTTHRPQITERQADGSFRFVDAPTTATRVVVVDSIPLAQRPSWPARLQHVTGPTATDVRLAGGDALDQAAAAWWGARARRQFTASLWADEARATR